MERPNTVAGLIEKRRFLVATSGDPADLAALDRVLRLFGAELDARALRQMRLPPPHKAAKGEVQRLVLDTIREAGRPVTSAEVAARYCERRGVPVELRDAIRSRVISRLTKMRQGGTVAKVVIGGRYRGWTLPIENETSHIRE